MKKVMLIAALLAMVLVAAVPAIAQVSQGVGAAEQESGGAGISFEVSNEGDSSNQCVGANQFANTGNVSNSQGVLQYASEADDFEFGGNEVSFSPEFEQACEQSVEQAAAASSTTVLK